MGKQPTIGQKKGKADIAKAATQKKGGHKKWTKGKAKEKSDHAVFLSREVYDRLIIGIPKLGRHISISTIVEKYKVVGSIARMMLRILVQSGALKVVEIHSRQALYTPTVAIVDKAVVDKKDGKKDKKQKKDKKKQ